MVTVALGLPRARRVGRRLGEGLDLLGGRIYCGGHRVREAQSEKLPHLDLIARLITDELTIRADRLLERRFRAAGFRERDRTLDGFDFDFNKKMNRRLVYDLAAGHFVIKHEDALFLGPPGTGKSHLAQAIRRCAIQQGHKVLYREAHVLIEDLADATIAGKRKEKMLVFASAPPLIIGDLGLPWRRMTSWRRTAGKFLCLAQTIPKTGKKLGLNPEPPNVYGKALHEFLNVAR